ncbi:MAG: hypothetical protein Q7R49_05910 [Candidatus Daviesbacteria bacterium]|nr:hypothetical protein [Candidatus Daviesbacteria bacterium]
MFLDRFVNQKKSRRFRSKDSDQMATQVRELLQKSDQKLILMVRG